jgi:propionate CoA-transferase
MLALPVCTRTRNRDDVDRVRRVVEERCQTIGKKVALVVNYDNFLIDAAVSDP